MTSQFIEDWPSRECFDDLTASRRVVTRTGMLSEE